MSKTPLSIALVIDVSDSVKLSRAWRAVSEAATATVGAAAFDAGDQISIVTASDRLVLRASQARSASLALSALSSIKPERRGFTAVWDGVLAASSLVADAPGRGLVVLISDGHDNSSWFERRRALRVLERNGIPVDGIEVAFGDEGEQSDIAPGPTTLRDLERTAGRYFSATSPNLTKELAARFADLHNSYVLTYTPENVKPQKDGWNEIKVTLRPGVRGRVVQARPGYYARTNK